MVWGVGLACVVPGLLYLAWREHTYGMLLPLPFYVKIAGAKTAWPGWGYVRDFSQRVVAPAAWPAVLGALAARRRHLPILAALLAIAAFFTTVNPIMDFAWRFLAPTLPLALVLAAGGAVISTRALLPERAGRWRDIAALALAAAAAWPLGAGRSELTRGYLAYADSTRAAHIALGRFLAAHTAPRTAQERLLVVSDAGAIPYYSGWRAIDSYGLCEPRVGLSLDRRFAPDWILDERPDLIVVGSGFAESFTARLKFEDALYRTAWARGYRPVKTLIFDENYFLWLLTPPGSDLAPALREWPVGREIGP
jgi:hypothetical protein